AKQIFALENGHFVGDYSRWDYNSAEEILKEISALTTIYTGVLPERLTAGEHLHWPVTSADHPGTPILHVGKFSRGLGKFTVCDHIPADELPDREYPLILTTGRVLYHWHGAEMTRRVDSLLALHDESIIEINSEDAQRYGIHDMDKVNMSSRRGEMIGRALVTDRIAPGVVFGSFHFPGEQNVNNLTNPALDPTAKIPEYKVCAVKIKAV
ncbi:MAG: molybdopterin dinucleotide binding domain-containing protein, partial [Anaerolineales bacterium]